MPKRVMAGNVVSARGDKTCVVRVQSLVKVNLYGKYVRKYKKYHAHDHENVCEVGDHIVIQESRPISKLKRWVFLRKVSKEEVA